MPIRVIEQWQYLIAERTRLVRELQDDGRDRSVEEDSCSEIQCEPNLLFAVHNRSPSDLVRWQAYPGDNLGLNITAIDNNMPRCVDQACPCDTVDMHIKGFGKQHASQDQRTT